LYLVLHLILLPHQQTGRVHGEPRGAELLGLRDGRVHRVAQGLVGADLVVQVLQLLVREERRLLLQERVGRRVQRLILILLRLELALEVLLLLLLLVLLQQQHDLLVLGVALLAQALHVHGHVHELLGVGGRQRHARRGSSGRRLHREDRRAFQLEAITGDFISLGFTMPCFMWLDISLVCQTQHKGQRRCNMVLHFDHHAVCLTLSACSPAARR